MNSQQFLSGYNYYQCCIMRTFTQDPVRIVNHPIIQQRFTIFDRMALAGMQRCPFTMVHLIKNELDLVSIKLEMLVFIIAAVDACDNELRDDNKITEPQRNEIKEFLRTMSNTCSYEVQQASQNLLHLKNNKKCNGLTLESVARLVEFGIIGSYLEQQLLMDPIISIPQSIKDSLTYIKQGNLAKNQRNYIVAINAFDQSLRLCPLNIEASYGKADALFNLSIYED